MESAGGLYRLGRQAHTGVAAISNDHADDGIVIARLSEGTAAQIVKLLDAYEIVVNDRIVPGARMGAALHVREAHVSVCRTADCELARLWLAPRAVRERPAALDAVGA